MLYTIAPAKCRRTFDSIEAANEAARDYSGEAKDKLIFVYELFSEERFGDSFDSAQPVNSYAAGKAHAIFNFPRMSASAVFEGQFIFEEAP